MNSVRPNDNVRVYDVPIAQGDRPGFRIAGHDVAVQVELRRRALTFTDGQALQLIVKITSVTE